jgi:hypothetical protein
MSPKILDDFMDLEPFAAEVDRDPRTIRRWMNEADGLPFVRIGNRLLIHVPTAREWILSRMQRPNPRAGTSQERLTKAQAALPKKRAPIAPNPTAA